MKEATKTFDSSSRFIISLAFRLIGYIYDARRISKLRWSIRYVFFPVLADFRIVGGKGHVVDDFFRRERKRHKNWRLKDPMNASERIDQLIAGLTDWRGKTLASVRKTILEADREIIEEWKWMGSPVWSHDGMIAVGNAHKDKVKLTFSHGASLPDPDKLFNAGLGGNTWRAIDFFEGDKINERALKISFVPPLITIR